MLPEKIKTFWQWFLENETRIKDAIDNEIESEQEYVVEQLNNLILDMGMLTWEIGPGDDSTWFLTISPNGNKELIKVTREIMVSAPMLKGWNFNYCKPPKNWNRKFFIYDRNMNQTEIDASTWHYVALKADDGSIELILEANNISHIDEDTAYSAADLVVTNEIGEEVKIQNISAVHIIEQLDEEYQSGKFKINHLKKQFSSTG